MMNYTHSALRSTISWIYPFCRILIVSINRRLPSLLAIVLKAAVTEAEAATVDVLITATPSPSMRFLDLGTTAKVPVLPEPKATVPHCDKVAMVAS